MTEIGFGFLELWPVRCYTCGKLLADKQLKFEGLIQQGYTFDQAINIIGIKADRYCCKRSIFNPQIIATGAKKPIGSISYGRETLGIATPPRQYSTSISETPDITSRLALMSLREENASVNIPPQIDPMHTLDFMDLDIPEVESIETESTSSEQLEIPTKKVLSEEPPRKKPKLSIVTSSTAKLSPKRIRYTDTGKDFVITEEQLNHLENIITQKLYDIPILMKADPKAHMLYRQDDEHWKGLFNSIFDKYFARLLLPLIESRGWLIGIISAYMIYRPDGQFHWIKNLDDWSRLTAKTIKNIIFTDVHPNINDYYILSDKIHQLRYHSHLAFEKVRNLYFFIQRSYILNARIPDITNQFFSIKSFDTFSLVKLDTLDNYKYLFGYLYNFRTEIPESLVLSSLDREIIRNIFPGRVTQVFQIDSIGKYSSNYPSFLTMLTDYTILNSDITLEIVEYQTEITKHNFGIDISRFPKDLKNLLQGITFNVSSKSLIDKPIKLWNVHDNIIGISILVDLPDTQKNIVGYINYLRKLINDFVNDIYSSLETLDYQIYLYDIFWAPQGSFIQSDYQIIPDSSDILSENQIKEKYNLTMNYKLESRMKPDTIISDEFDRIKNRVDNFGELWNLIDFNVINSYVDIGAGTGSISRAIRDSLNIAPSGATFLDIEPAAEDVQKITENKLSVPTNSIGLVTAFVSFHHFESFGEMLNEIRRITMNSGFLFIREHNSISIDDVHFLNFIHIVDMVNRKQNEIRSYYAKYYSFRNLNQYLLDSGYLLELSVTQPGNNPMMLYHALYRLTNKNIKLPPNPNGISISLQDTIDYLNTNIQFKRKSYFRLKKRLGITSPDENLKYDTPNNLYNVLYGIKYI